MEFVRLDQTATKGSARPCRWLVVLDDVADLADLRELWPPAVPNGHTVITSRRRHAALTGLECGAAASRPWAFRPRRSSGGRRAASRSWSP